MGGIPAPRTRHRSTYGRIRRATCEGRFGCISVAVAGLHPALRDRGSRRDRSTAAAALPMSRRVIGRWSLKEESMSMSGGKSRPEWRQASDGMWYPAYVRSNSPWDSPVPAKINRMAILSFVSGAYMTMILLTPEHVRMAVSPGLRLTVAIVSLLVSLVGTSCGVASLVQIRQSYEQGKTLAILGLIPTALTLLVADVVIIILLLLLPLY